VIDNSIITLVGTAGFASSGALALTGVVAIECQASLSWTIANSTSLGDLSVTAWMAAARFFSGTAIADNVTIAIQYANKSEGKILWEGRLFSLGVLLD
jgi:hypothetical protein